MKFDDLFSNIDKVAFDTAPIIYFVEKNVQFFDKILHIIRFVDNTSLDGIASVLLLTEVLTYPQKLNNQQLITQYETILSNNRSLTLLPVSRSIARYAATLRANYNIRTPDAIHLATAIEHKADIFLTNDIQLKRITEVSVIILDDIEIDE